MMTKLKKESRETQLELMHRFMLESNDEELYMSWISGGVPDCPDEVDYESIAEDDGLYEDCCKLFAALIQEEGWKW